MNATPSTIEAFPQVSGLRSQVSPRAPSGFAKLRTLLLRLIAPDTLEADLATEYITETRTGLDNCHASSTRTETLVERLRTRFNAAVADYLKRERLAVSREIALLCADSPYRKCGGASLPN